MPGRRLERACAQYAESSGIRIGAINPNVFRDDAYRLGSLCHPDAAVRRRRRSTTASSASRSPGGRLDDHQPVVRRRHQLPGQDDLRSRKRGCCWLEAVYAHLPPASRMLVEYKFFEPAFYSTDLPDWGTAYALCLKLGPQAQVLVDLGHHAQGVNIEQIVAFLLDEGRLGGFHFNNRKYADDDLIVGSVNPYELFLIYARIALAQTERAETVAPWPT